MRCWLGTAFAALSPIRPRTIPAGSSTTTTLEVPAPTGAFHVGTRSIALIDQARREPEAPKQPRSLVIRSFHQPYCAENSAAMKSSLMGVK